MAIIKLKKVVFCDTLFKHNVGVMFKRFFVPHIFFSESGSFLMHTFFCRTIDIILLDNDNFVISVARRITPFKIVMYDGYKLIETLPDTLQLREGDIISLPES